MRWFALMMLILALLWIVPVGAQQTIRLTAWTIGPEEASRTRATNLVEAAQRLNKALEEEKAPYRVSVETSFETTNWDTHRRRILLAFQSGKAPDIVQAAHIDVAPWSDAGYIIPLDPYLDKYPSFKDVIPTLWNAVKYKGKIWGVPQDTEARPFYFNKELLGKLGWSAADIAALPRMIREGKFTWQDVLKVGKEAVDRGVVARGYGYWHRPVRGPDFYHFYYNFGGRLQDPRTGQLIFTQAAALEMFRFFDEMAAQGVTRRDLIGTPWPIWHRTITDGRVLFWSAGTWSWAEWATQYVKDRGGYEYLWPRFGFALQPASAPGRKPITLSQPMAYMVWSGSRQKDLAVRLLSFVLTPELDTKHAVGSAHLAVLKSTTKYGPYVKDRFLRQVTYMLNYTTFQPVHPRFGQYDEIFFRALSAVEAGRVRPEEAVRIVADELRATLRDQVIIE